MQRSLHCTIAILAAILSVNSCFSTHLVLYNSLGWACQAASLFMSPFQWHGGRLNLSVKQASMKRWAFLFPEEHNCLSFIPSLEIKEMKKDSRRTAKIHRSSEQENSVQLTVQWCRSISFLWILVYFPNKILSFCFWKQLYNFQSLAFLFGKVVVFINPLIL